ncbi:MAG: response regulator [Treponema sp.]|nr:response regulator [Treponema sp.]
MIKSKKSPYSLKLKARLGISSLVGLTFFLTTGISTFQQSLHMESDLEQTSSLIANEKLGELNTLFSAVESSVLFSKNYILKTLDEERILHDAEYEQQYLTALSEQMTSFPALPKSVVSLYFRMEIERFGSTRGIFLSGSPKNGFITVKNTDLHNYSPTDTEHVGWYYMPIWKKLPVWINPYLNKNLNIYMISYVVPLFKNDRLLGVVGTDINLASVKDIVNTLPATSALGLIIGESGNLLYANKTSEKVSTVEMTANTSSLIDKFMNGKEKSLQSFTWNRTEHMGVMRKLNNGMSLVVAIPRAKINQQRIHQQISLLLVLAFVTILTWLSVTYAVERIVNPILQMSDATFKLARGELNVPIPYESKNELGQLAHNLRKMDQQMGEYIAYIREQAEKERTEKEAALAESKSKSDFLASLYISMHDINLTDNTFEEVQARRDIGDAVHNAVGNANEVLQQVMLKTASQSSWKDILKFVNLRTLNDRMGDKITIAQEFLGAGGKWCRGRFITMTRREDGSLHHVLWAVEYIDEERKARERLEAEAEQVKAESNAKSEFLASMYLSLHEIDLNTDTFFEITSRADIAKHIGPAMTNARATVHRVMQERVQNQGQARKDFMEFINFDTLEERLKSRITIAHEFYSIMGYWCRARFIAMDRNPDGTLHHVLWAVENINEERAERERLQGEVAKSIAASQAKSAFLANMSHEIRTPINAVLGMDEMILRESDNKEILSYAANIKSAGTSLLAIINDILDFSKIEAGKMELLPENYDISSLIVDLVNMIDERSKKKGLEFILKSDEGLPKTLHGDSVRLKQCILNLLTNAVKYTQAGSITFTVGYKKLDKNLIALEVSVTDTGIGIKEQDMERLFSPFERIEEGKNKTIEGTGLGMSIVKKILAMMDTRLEVESTYGKGSNFHFTVKQPVIDWTPVGNITQTSKQISLQLQKYKEKLIAPKARILFVDDTDMNLEVVKGLLKKTRITIDTVLSGKEALEKVRQHTYDMLFIDHRMPEMDGIQTLHAMKKLTDNKSAGKPCIALTANAISGVRQMYLNEGFTDYLSKPVNPEKLEALIIKYLPEDYLEAASEEISEEAAEGASLSGDTSEIVEKLRAIEGIDADAALANCGSESLLEDMVTRFRNGIDEKAAELENLFDSEDIRNYGIKVHALKSTSRLIGALELSKEAEFLEHCADEKNWDEIKARHATLLEHFTNFKQKLAPVTEAETAADSAEKPLIPENTFKALAEKLFKSASDFNIDGADEAIAELSAYRMPDALKDTFEKMRTCVQNVDYSGLKKLIKEKHIIE